MLDIQIREMTETDIDPVVGVIGDSSYRAYEERARRTISKHFESKGQGDSDGRTYDVAIVDSKVVGIGGLHHLEWGPDDVVWLGWFHVHPEYQRKGIGTRMMNHVCDKARADGHRRLFVEVYKREELSRGLEFYKGFGFEVVGGISDYDKEGVDMVVYGMKL